MIFTITSLNDCGTGMKFDTAADFRAEILKMVEDCINNGGQYFDVMIDADASCFCEDEEENEELFA